jgi:hypothetical protein
MITGPQEGEFFVDQQEKPIPPKNTWDDLTVIQLIDVKVQLQDKLYSFYNNPAIARVLKQSIAELEALISSRSSS